MYAMCISAQGGLKGTLGPPETGVAGSRGSPDTGFESSGPAQEQQVPLSTEHLPQPYSNFWLYLVAGLECWLSG